ncbi:MAG: potassium transporter TrkG [Candidatus Omnitrophota bacterium]
MFINNIINNKFFNRNPEALILCSFLMTILVGGCLLKLPYTVQPGVSLSWIDALFMSTSATCVTGLSVIDIGTKFSFFGQMVILILIQVGGLGTMTLSLLFLMLLGRRASLTTRGCLASLSNEVDLRRIRLATFKIFIYSIVLELLGAILLFFYLQQKHDTGFAIYSSIFHSISAFCNAGFSLYTESLVYFQHSAYVQCIIMALIILGGIGFIVMNDVFSTLFRKKNNPFKKHTLHTKIAIIGTFFLIIFGTLMIWLLERTNILSQMSLPYQFLNAAFLSITSRTAGFNSIDTSSLSNGTLFFVIGLMFIGGCPGSTAGGVKVNTVFVLICFVVSQFKGTGTASFSKRKISPDVIYKSAAIIIASVALVMGAVFILQITESINQHCIPGQERGNFIVLLFEAVSAFGTVGLSAGNTSAHSGLGEFVLIVLMYIGRVGPLTLGFALQRISNKTADFEYPEEDIFIG